jgi:hypothetical protein
MKKGRIDKNKLFQLLADGKNLTECANHFGVSPAAVHKAKKGGAVTIARDIQAESAHRFVDHHLNTVDQLRRINQKAFEILDKAKSDPALALKAMNEIRGQLRLQNETLSMLAEMSATIEFQEGLIQLLKEIDSNVKDEFIRRLSKRRALRGAVRIN